MPDAFLADFEQYEEPPPETSSTMQWTCNCLLPPGACNDKLEATYGQRESALQAALIRDSNHAKWVFEERQMKCMPKMAGFMGSWAKVRKRSALCARSSKETCQLVPPSSKHTVGLSFFLIDTVGHIREGVHVDESICGPQAFLRPSFVH